MSRLFVSSTLSAVLVLAICLAVPGQAAAGGSKVADAMGDLRWGMNEGEVIRHVQRKLKEKYEPLIRKESNLKREEQLREELREKTFAVRKSLVEFQGQKTNWDVSNLAGEFTHGNSESMLFTKDRDSATYYFFIDGHLWKWIKTYDAAVFGGPNFGKFQKVISKKFGKGHVKSGQRNDERKQQRWVEFVDRTSRMRAVDDTEFYGNYALVFEEMDTVRQLASLRTNTVKQGGSKKDSKALAEITDKSQGAGSHASVVDKITGKDRRNAGKLTRKKRSLFADEEKQESQAEYEARRKREEAAAKARQRKAYERKQRKKIGKALEGIPAADEDDDPLSGL